MKDLPYPEDAVLDSPDLISLSGTISGCTLSMQVEAASGCIESASHQSSDDQTCQMILDILCSTIIDWPLEEVAACGASSVLRQIAVRHQSPRVAGVLMPRNSSPVFAEIEVVLRQMLKKLPDQGRAPSRHHRAQGSTWVRLALEAQEAILTNALLRFLEIKNISKDSVKFETLENDVLGRPVRAIFSFMPHCVTGYEALPGFIRQLERFIRVETNAPIEVLAGEQKDRNKLRRMIVVTKTTESRG